MLKKIGLVTIFFLLFSVVAYAEDINDLIFQASDLHYQVKLIEAKALFEKVIRLDPNNKFALNQLVLLSAKQEVFA
ncbi:MAG TPA: hypothetical protein DIT19_04355, partial [Desulfonauticus sp.]|nr:hypothetical protein [Desulfonauticus sp.]